MGGERGGRRKRVGGVGLRGEGRGALAIPMHLTRALQMGLKKDMGGRRRGKR